MDEKRAYAVAALDVSPEEVAANLTDYQHYCPVSYIADEISVSSAFNDWLNIVKHNGKFYHAISVEYRLAFLVSPVPFVYSWCDRKFDFAVTNLENAVEPEHEGYDVIDLSAGRFVKGNGQLIAVFRGKLFRFITEEHRHEFCEHPERYIDVPLPAHRPVDPPPTLATVPTMPAVAFLEQGVGDVVTECIVELTKRRPKIPGRGMIKSMNQYIAAYIRANAPGVGPILHERFVKQMEEMNELVGLAETLKKSLETPYEMRDEVEHERLCKLWNETRHHGEA
jgi:YHS domain-containing protein